MCATTLPLILAFVFLPCSDPNDSDAGPVVPWATTRPTRRKVENHELPADVTAALDVFRQALRDSDWNHALSCCTAQTRDRAKQHQSKEQYLREFVPLKELLALPAYQSCGGKGYPGHPIMFDFFLTLSEHPEGDTIQWNWWLDRTTGAWLVELPDVSVEQYTKKEIARHRRAKEEAEAMWKALEPKLEGLRTQLTALPGEHRVGQPMPFRLELINEGRYELWYDRQQVAVNASMTITDKDGRVVPYTAGCFQTGGGHVAIQPGATAVLFENLDIAKQYDMSKPGIYRVRFNGHGLEVEDADMHSKGLMGGARKLFASNTVEIHVKPGPLQAPETPKTGP